LLSAVKAARPDSSPQSLALARDPSLAAIVGLGREGSLYVNPYTAAVLGSASLRTSEFFQSMTDWHRYVAMSGESRATGRSITGISNAAFLVLALSGLYIWWPKQLTRKALKPIVWFRQTSTGRARDFNWHNTIGFWCLIPIVIMTGEWRRDVVPVGERSRVPPHWITGASARRARRQRSSRSRARVTARSAGGSDSRSTRPHLGPRRSASSDMEHPVDAAPGS
jgi:hypothetical protein